MEEIQTVQLLQPWSTFVAKTKLPKFIFDKMIEITDDIHNDSDLSFIDLEILKFEKVMSYFLDMIREFVIQQMIQAKPFKQEEIKNDKWYTSINNMWIVSQKDGEFQPCHIHPDSHVSGVLYLKIPEYISDKKKSLHETYLPKNEPMYLFQQNTPKKIDGAITFLNNGVRDPFWGEQRLTIKPEVGDFYLFPSSLQHFVYPFRSVDGMGERKGVSFNSRFTSKLLEEEKTKNTESEWQKVTCK
jgi:hypothetical protein